MRRASTSFGKGSPSATDATRQNPTTERDETGAVDGFLLDDSGWLVLANRTPGKGLQQCLIGERQILAQREESHSSSLETAPAIERTSATGRILNDWLPSFEQSVPFPGYQYSNVQLRLCIAMEKFWSLRTLILPKLLKTTGRKLGIAHRVLNILVSQIVLDGSCIMPLID